MQQLIAVAEERNFTRAATALGMTQPALSRAIASLEAEAGLMLFERFPTGVAPTAAGEQLIQDARHLLGSVALVEHNVRQQGRGDMGKLSFALGPLAAACLLKHILADTLTAAPQLEITAVIRETAAIIDGVMEGSFDFGICSANTLRSASGVEAIPLAVYPMGLFVRAGHPLLALGRAVAWDDLLPYPRVTGRYPVEGRFTSARPFGPLDTTVECNDFEILRATTAATDAIWLTATALVDGGDAANRLVPLEPQPLYDMPVAEIILVRQANRILGPAAQRVIDITMALPAGR